jgi:26S proteasome regulatory subunit T2
MNQERLKP